MFYNSEDELKYAINNTGTSIVLEKDTEILEKVLENAILVTEQTADGMQEVINMTTTKSTIPRYFIFKNAEKLSSICQNRILKLLEEPKENYHFILQTTSPEALLATIRSRALIYAPLELNKLEKAPEAEKDVFELAKRLLVADDNGILDILDEISKKKIKESTMRREYVLNILKTTIELAEKSYFKTEKEVFTKKINGLIMAYKNISENGNLKLQFIANLV